ncbi:unnamed protein product [Caenorhabditis brenneri]
MLYVMMMNGVNPNSRLFCAHRLRHAMLRVFLRVGVQPYSEELQQRLPALMLMYARFQACCGQELQRFEWPQ